MFGELLALKWREKFGRAGYLQKEIGFGLRDFLVQMAKKSWPGTSDQPKDVG